MLRRRLHVEDQLASAEPIYKEVGSGKVRVAVDYAGFPFAASSASIR